MKKDWLKNPDVCAKVTAAVLLLALFLGIHFFADALTKPLRWQSAAMSTAWWNICAPLDHGRF